MLLNKLYIFALFCVIASSFPISKLKVASCSKHFAVANFLDQMVSQTLKALSTHNFGDIIPTSIQLSDTSISEEEILDVSGQVTTLPDPLFAVGFAIIVFLGVAALQFSLGDLTKEVIYFLLCALLLMILFHPCHGDRKGKQEFEIFCKQGETQNESGDTSIKRREIYFQYDWVSSIVNINSQAFYRLYGSFC